MGLQPRRFGSFNTICMVFSQMVFSVFSHQMCITAYETAEEPTNNNNNKALRVALAVQEVRPN